MIGALGLEDFSNLWLNIMTMLLGERPCVGISHFCGIDFLRLAPRNVPDKCVDAAGHAEVLLWQHFEREIARGSLPWQTPLAKTFLSLTCNQVDNNFLKDPRGEGPFGRKKSPKKQFHTFCFWMNKTLHTM